MSKPVWLDHASDLWKQGYSVDKIMDSIVDKYEVIVSKNTFDKYRHRHDDMFPERSSVRRGPYRHNVRHL